MMRHRWIGWLAAIVLAVSLFGPAVSGVRAQDDEGVATPEVVTTEEATQSSDETGEGATEQNSDDPASGGEQTPEATEEETPVVEETPAVEPTPTEDTSESEGSEGSQEVVEDAEESLDQPVEAAAPPPDTAGPPSGNGVQPVLIESNIAGAAPVECSLLGYSGYIGLKIEPPNGGTQGGITVTRTDTAEGQFFSWSSSEGVAAVYVKAGTGGNLYEYNPTATSDTLLHAPLQQNGNIRDISHITFCLPGTEPPGDTGSVTIEKYYCEVDTLEEAGTEFSIDAPVVPVSEDCVSGDADFAILPFDDRAYAPITFTVYGSATINGLPVGEHRLTEITNSGGESILFPIVANETTLIKVYNNLYTPKGDLELEKIYCEGDETKTEFILGGGVAQASDEQSCERGAADFQIFPFLTGDPIDVSTDAQGFLFVPGLPEGTHLLKEVSSGATTEFTIIDGQTTFFTVINFYVPEVPTGTLYLEKIYCLGDEAKTEFYFESVQISSGNAECYGGPADFEIWPFGDENAAIDVSTDQDGFLTVPGLPAGTHVLKEVSSGATTNFGIEPEGVTSILVVNTYVPEVPTGHVLVLKYFCYADHASTSILVGQPGGWPSPEHGTDHCWKGDADFQIWPFGDESAAIAFSTGHDGEASLVVPVTNAETGPHAILEVGSGVAATFDIDENKTTVVKVLNYVKKDYPQPPHKPTYPSGGEAKPAGGTTVTTLPSTGAGATGQQGTTWLLLAGLAGLAVLGGRTLRRGTVH